MRVTTCISLPFFDFFQFSMPSALSVFIYLSLAASAFATANFTRRADGSAFQADPSIDVDALYKAVKAGAEAKKNMLATYRTCNGTLCCVLRVIRDITNVLCRL